jgi:hypothetical protein
VEQMRLDARGFRQVQCCSIATRLSWTIKTAKPPTMNQITPSSEPEQGSPWWNWWEPPPPPDRGLARAIAASISTALYLLALFGALSTRNWITLFALLALGAAVCLMRLPR